MTAHLTPDSSNPMSKDQIKLRQAISQTWQSLKQGRGYLSSLSAQTALVYGAFLLLGQAIFGDSSIGTFLEVLYRQNPEELAQYNSPFVIAAAVTRSALDWFFPALLESAVIVYLYRRFIENDQQVNEITDLKLTMREFKVFGVFMLSSVLLSTLAQSFFGVLTKLSSDPSEVHDTAYAVKMAICATGFLASFYSMLRLMLAPMLAPLEPKKSFKKSWNLTKGRSWFFALFTSMLYIPSIVLQMIVLLVLQKMTNAQTLPFSFSLVLQILGLILKVIPVYMGFITVYKSVKDNPAVPSEFQSNSGNSY